MATVYAIWVLSAALFIAGLVAMKTCEKKTARRDESKVDPMFGGPRSRQVR